MSNEIVLNKIEKIAIDSILEKQRRLAEEHAATQQLLNELTLEVFKIHDIDPAKILNPQLDDSGTKITYHDIPEPPKQDKDFGQY